MWFLLIVGWLACVVYSTIPLFWFMVHPLAERWRARERSPFRVLLPVWIVMWFVVGSATAPWHRLAFYSTWWSWLPAVLLFARGTCIYSRAGAHFSWAQLSGLPEVRADHQDDRLVTTGIRARVRHPVYLAHLCEMLAWSVGTGLVVCWGLTVFAVATGAVMIRMEDAELEKRFGEEFRKYRNRVPAILPGMTSWEKERPKLSCDGAAIRCEFQHHEGWQIPIAELVCIGEYTKANGPWLDDYFLVFGVKGDVWYEASCYSDGQDETIRAVGEVLGCDLHVGLIRSTTRATRILWPKELEGSPLFVDANLNPELKRLADSRQL